MRDVCIVVLAYNGLDDTLRCLESLAAVQDEARVLVVDNGSSEDIAASVASRFSWVDVRRNPTNEGYAGGNNRGIEKALEGGAALVVLLNNDTVVAPDIVSRLRAAAQAHPDYGVIGPVIGYMDEPGVVRTDGCLFNVAGQPGFFQRLEVNLAAGASPSVADVDIVNGCCLMARAEVFRAIGLIDERFFLVHEESDFCLRATEAGFRCGVLAELLVWHKGSSSFRRVGHGTQRYFDVRNLALLIRKHRRAHYRGRTQLATWFEYIKYAYYVYCREREDGTAVSADAVAEGFLDGLAGIYGARSSRRRWLLPVVRGVAKVKRRMPLARRPQSRTQL